MSESLSTRDVRGQQNIIELPVGSFRNSDQPSDEGCPKTSLELATAYGVSDKTIQNWFKTVCKAYPWIPATELKLGAGNKIRYSVQFQTLLTEYRKAANTMSADEWIAVVHAAHPDNLVERSTPEPEIAPQDVALVTCEVVGVEDLVAQNEALTTALAARRDATEALTGVNETRLDQLREFLSQRQQTNTALDQQRQEELHQQGVNEALEEFIIVEKAKAQTLQELQNLSALGKLGEILTPHSSS